MLARSGRFTVTDLCEQFGVSRKTGYKHLERYAELVIFDYLEPFSNPMRRHSSLDYLSPVAFEKLHHQNIKKAA